MDRLQDFTINYLSFLLDKLEDHVEGPPEAILEETNV